MLLTLGCTGGDANDPGAPGDQGDQAAQQPLAVSVDRPAVVRIYFDDRAELDALAGENAPWEVHHDRGYAVFEVRGQSEIDELRAIGYRVEIDQSMTDRMHAPAPEDIGLSGIPGYSCYRTVEETYASAAALAAGHPTLATWSDIGNSWKKNLDGTGYDINVLRLTNQAIPGPKPVMFAMGGIHAREYTTAELLTRFAEYLVNNHGSDPDATWLLDHHEVHLVLQSNPDGRKFAEGGQLWRKNTNQNYCGSTSSSRGADLNRNYPYQWGGSGSSSSPCNTTYRGAFPASEPETQAITDYVRLIFPDQRDELQGPNAPVPANATGIFFDMHSYGGLVLWPWGYTSATTPSNAGFRTLGRKLAFFSDYMPQQAIDLYVTTGTTDDFVYGELGVAAYTIEMGTSFFQSCSAFENTVFPDNLESLLYAAKVARTPYLTPAGPEALSVTLASSSVVQGQPVAISAVLNDGRYSNNNGIEPVQAVAGADVYVGNPPWAGSFIPTVMVARDGNFNTTVETADATIDTSGLAPGTHLIYVEGHDSSGNRGPVSAAFLEILPGGGNQFPTVTITNPGSGTTVGAGTAVDLVATASDVEDGDLTAGIVWTSSISGPIGTGGSASVVLTVGTHTITASVSDSDSADASASIVVHVTPPALFEETFDDGAAGWTASGLWHLVTNTSCTAPAPGAPSLPNAMYYGQDSTCNYDAGSNSGTLESPPISGITASSVLTFNYFRVVESSGSARDITGVDVLVGSSTTNVFVRNSTHPSVAEWVSSGNISLAGFAGQTIRLRFRFHSRTSLNNSHTGWLVDDIVIQ